MSIVIATTPSAAFLQNHGCVSYTLETCRYNLRARCKDNLQFRRSRADIAQSRTAGAMRLDNGVATPGKYRGRNRPVRRHRGGALCPEKSEGSVEKRS